MALKVLLDANFLMMPGQRVVDVFEELPLLVQEEHVLITLSTVVKELERISSTRGRGAVAASVALGLIKAKNVQVVEASGEADESIKKYASEAGGGVLVCTNDRVLRSYLRSRGVGVVCLRGKGSLTRI